MRIVHLVHPGESQPQRSYIAQKRLRGEQEVTNTVLPPTKPTAQEDRVAPLLPSWTKNLSDRKFIGVIPP
jgi:hypothetical protein